MIRVRASVRVGVSVGVAVSVSIHICISDSVRALASRLASGHGVVEPFLTEEVSGR